MVYVASTLIENTKGFQPITLKFKVEKNGRISIVENTEYNSRIKVWQLLDLFAEIMPKYIHAVGYEVELSTRPVKYLFRGFTSQPCLTLKKEKWTYKKYFLLEKIVDTDWMTNISLSCLRPLVYWWRLHREEFSRPTWEWEFFLDEN